MRIVLTGPGNPGAFVLTEFVPGPLFAIQLKKIMHTNDKEETVILQVYNDAASAAFDKAKLAEKNIESFLLDENPVGFNPLGGIELKVFAKDLERAKDILVQ